MKTPTKVLEVNMLFGIKKKKKKIKWKCNKIPKNEYSHSEPLVSGWLWARVTEPVGWHWVVGMSSFRALQTSQHEAMTQCTVDAFRIGD